MSTLSPVSTRMRVAMLSAFGAGGFGPLTCIVIPSPPKVTCAFELMLLNSPLTLEYVTGLSESPG